MDDAAKEAGTGAGSGDRDSARGRFRPPTTISRGDYLNDGEDTEFRETVYLLVQCLGRLLACREAFGRQLDLTASQFAVLIGAAYCQNDTGVTIRDLAAHVALAPTHVTTEVGRLIRLGLLEKRRNESDRRSVLVFLTKRGEQAVERIAPLVRQVNDVLFDGISAQDLNVMQRAAKRLLTNSEYAAAELRVAEASKRKGPGLDRSSSE